MNSIDILLIEDNPGDIELTRESLSCGKLKNTLRVVTDGEQALDYLFQRGEFVEQALPDLVLLDLNLPKVNGREILKELKENESRQNIPVIILSSPEAARDIKESYRLHADCFISKPMKTSDFMKVIQTIERFSFA